MKMLFVHSGEKVKVDENGAMYTDGSYNSLVWERYLSIASDLTILMRKDPAKYGSDDANRRFNLIGRSNIGFCELPDLFRSIRDYMSIRRRNQLKQVVDDCVKAADIVIVRLPGDLQAVNAARRQKKPYLLEVVGDPFASLWHHSLRGKFLALPAKFELKKAVKAAPYVLYVTKEFLQREYPTKGQSAGVSDVSIDEPDQEVLLKRLDAIRTKSGAIVLGTLGDIDTKYKGHKNVIKALVYLKKCSGKTFEYQVVGGGDPANIKMLAGKYGLEDEVKILGSMRRDEVFNWLDGIDVYIQPSHTEGLPRSVVEAMSRGLPCIGSNVGGIPELLNRKYICPKGMRMGRRIAEILANLDGWALEEMAKENFEHAKEYCAGTLDYKRNKFYNQLLEDKVDT